MSDSNRETAAVPVRGPQVGDTWRTRPGRGFNRERTGVETAVIAADTGTVTYRYSDGLTVLSKRDRFGDDQEFVRGPETVPVATGWARDWSAWLPPHGLPDTGPKTFRVGQVWAWLEGKARAVGMVDEADESAVGFRNLASVAPYARGLGFRFGKHGPSTTVLVADVGCEPTPPSVLYASPAATPEPVKREEAGKPAGFALAGCWKTKRGGHQQYQPSCSDCLAIQGVLLPQALIQSARPHGNKGAAMGKEGGPGLGALTLPEARPRYVCAVDDFDLLPDAQEGWRR